MITTLAVRSVGPRPRCSRHRARRCKRNDMSAANGADRASVAGARSGRRPDEIHILKRAECIAGVRGVDAERGRLLHLVLRLHELELAGGIRYSHRSRKRYRPWRTRPGATHALLSAAQSVPVYHPRAEGFWRQGTDMDTRDARKSGEGVRVAQERLPD